MKKYSMEFSVGLFVLVGLLCLGYMTVKLGKMELFSEKGHTFSARFSSISGLRVGASVEISGVPVGKVTSIALKTDSYEALVALQIDDDVVITDDAIASVKTSGIIGDKYVSISIGAGDPVENGGEITETESAVDLEALISKYVFGGVE